MSNINAHQKVKPQTLEANSPILIDSAALGKKDSIRILHVDDDPSIKELTKLMLLDFDSSFEIDNACCVDEGLTKLAAKTYDLVVSDYEMPHKNGLDFLQELRQNKNLTPFILFTGKGREEVAIDALNLGADGYINKQGNPETVYGELAHVIVQIVNQNCLKTDLAESEVRFKQFFSNLPNAVAVYEAISNGEDFVFKDFNAAAEKIEKISKADVIGKRVTEIFPGAKEFGILEIFKRVWKTGQSEYFPATLYQDKRDIGSWRENWLFKLPNGNVVAVYNDVTERVKTDLELKRTNEIIERVGEGIDAGLAVIGKDYSVFWANKRLKDLGVAPNKKCYQTFNRSETVCLDCGVKKIFEQKISLDVHEYKTKNSNGETVWVELRVTPLKDKDGNVTAALELAVPITERKKAEDELSGKEKRFRAIFDKSFQFALLLDINGNVLEMNELCYTVHGPLAEASLGKPFWKAAWWSQFPEVAEKTKLAIQNCQVGKIVHDEVEFIDKDFQIHQGIRIFSPIADENGKLLYISVVGLDISERKKAEDALRRSEEKHRIISGITADVTFSCTKKGEEEFFVDWISDACEEIFGYSAKEIQEKGCWKFTVQPQDLPIFEEKLTNLKLGQKSKCELMITNKNGSTRWLKVNSTVEEDIEKPGSPRLLGACIDITERKKREFELQLERNKLETVTENIGAGLFLVDKDYKILWTNNLSKYHFGELESKQCYLAFRNRNEVCPDCGVREIFEKGKEIVVREHCFKDSKGDPGWLELTARPVKDETGKVVAALELAVPITARKKAEVNLLKNKALLLEAEKAGRIGGWEFDINTLTQSWTDETFRILEIDLTHGEPIVPKGIEFINPPYRATANEAIQRAIEHGEPYDQEWEITTAKGNKRWVHAVAKANYENSKIKSISGSFQDITERKKAEEIRKGLESKVKQYSEHLKNMVDLRTAQLKDANERLVKAERLAAIGELAGMIGHDLRNPLAGIKNGVYLLKKKGTTISEAQSKEILEIIDKAIDHSNKIINDLLDYSREMNLKLIKYAARPLVDEAIRSIQVPDRIQIVNHVDEEAYIWVDADKMIRVFVNLLQNAIDATPENGNS